MYMCAVCVDMCMCVYEWHIYVKVCVEEKNIGKSGWEEQWRPTFSQR